MLPVMSSGFDTHPDYYYNFILNQSFHSKIIIKVTSNTHTHGSAIVSQKVVSAKISREPSSQHFRFY